MLLAEAHDIHSLKVRCLCTDRTLGCGFQSIVNLNFGYLLFVKVDEINAVLLGNTCANDLEIREEEYLALVDECRQVVDVSGARAALEQMDAKDDASILCKLTRSQGAGSGARESGLMMP